MSILGEVLDELAENIIPDVASIVFPDTCNISRETVTKDAGGAPKTAWSNVNASPIPCAYEPKTKGFKDANSGQYISVMEYYITLPTNQDGSLIDIQPKDRIAAIARGNQPAKTFRITAIKNDSGVVLEAICNLEN